MIQNFFRGAAYVTEGFKLLFQPGFRLFILIPVTVNIVLFSLLIMWAKSMFSGWMAYLMGWLPEWLAFMEWFFWIIYLVAILMTIFYGFVAAANLLAAPFYGYLSELVEERLGSHRGQGAFEWSELVKMIPRTVMREIQKILYYLPRVIALLILGLIPGLNAIVAVVWIIFSAWMMAIQYLDYPADNNNLSFREMLRYLRKNRSTSLGFGTFTFGLTLIPIVNLITFPAAVCGATAFWVNQQQGRISQDGSDQSSTMENEASNRRIGH